MFIAACFGQVIPGYPQASVQDSPPQECTLRVCLFMCVHLAKREHRVSLVKSLIDLDQKTTMQHDHGGTALTTDADCALDRAWRFQSERNDKSPLQGKDIRLQ